MAAISLLALAACDDGPSAQDQLAQDAAVVERVRQANEEGAPLEPVVPDIITAADRETNDLLGDACMYMPGTSMGERVIAREADAFMKIDGEMVRFAADPGSRPLPANTRTLYNGRGYALRLAVEGNGEGTVFLYDRFDRTVYTGSGAVDCGELDAAAPPAASSAEQ
ncbi:MAG: hypothetical protein WBA68_09915 [Alteraurantiacibacter sp.]